MLAQLTHWRLPLDWWLDSNRSTLDKYVNLPNQQYMSARARLVIFGKR
jgi:hypothetical protein